MWVSDKVISVKGDSLVAAQSCYRNRVCQDAGNDNNLDLDRTHPKVSGLGHDAMHEKQHAFHPHCMDETRILKKCFQRLEHTHI